MNNNLEKKVLMLLEEDARLTPGKLAIMLDVPVEDIKEILLSLEERGVVLGYKAVIDWDKTERECVTAIIELKVTPHKEKGFGKVAERISNYPEVTSIFLMSGSYDYCVTIEGKTMKEVAMFVAEKLATLENVVSTSTHFVLKKYKDNGVAFDTVEKETIEERGNTN